MDAVEVWLLLFRPLAFPPPNLAAPTAPPFLFMGMEQSRVSQSAQELGYQHTGEP